MGAPLSSSAPLSIQHAVPRRRLRAVRSEPAEPELAEPEPAEPELAEPDPAGEAGPDPLTGLDPPPLAAPGSGDGAILEPSDGALPEPGAENRPEWAEDARSRTRPLPRVPRLDAGIIGKIAVFSFEAVEGTRPLGQLGRWITESVADELATVRALNVERRSLFHDYRRIVPSVRRVRSMVPVAGITEASVVLVTPSRARGVALRFELLRGRWQATSITIL